MNKINKLLGDFIGLWHVCGLAVALQWVFQVLANSREVVRRGDLQTVDHAMGTGPFAITLNQYGCKFSVCGPQVISGIREMYVRDVYLRNGWLRINDGDIVFDLGANMGNFTNMALSMGPNVRVVAVEPSRWLNSVFTKSVAVNDGHERRVQLFRAFLGKAGKKQLEAIAEESADYSDAPWITEEELIERTGISKIDFLKCDIEGGEFGLLTPSSKLLSITKSLAVEVHAFAGDVGKFVSDIEYSGFEIGPVQHDHDGSVTFLAKRK